MKRYSNNLNIILFIALIVVGCTPTSLETVASTQFQISTEPSETVASTQSHTSTEPSVATEILIPITGLSMEVGLTYSYVDGSTLIAVPRGEFIMGADGIANPKHMVTLNDFWIYSTKVTNQQYALCVELGQCTSPDPNDNPSFVDPIFANNPVIGITYEQAATYCDFINGRLPTEAEWEKSARGLDGSLYPWGNAAPSCDLLNFNNCVGDTTNVVNYQGGASYYRGLDFAGNTYEWTADWYDPNYYANSPYENPQGPGNGLLRSVRSSSFKSNADQVAVMKRNSENPQKHRSDLSFRCVVDDPMFFAPFCEFPKVYGQNTGTRSAQETIVSESCPVLEITQGQYCMRKSPRTNVIFVGPPNSIIDSSDCIPSPDPYLFTCQTPETVVSITADCQLDLPENPSCPFGYYLQDKLCVADGGIGQCLNGWKFDSLNNCCTAEREKGSLSDFAVCPVGTFYLKSQLACLPIPVLGKVSVSLKVDFISCGDTGGRSCRPRECGLSESWDPNLCCCTADGKSCT